jgi:hypothetical protein
MAVSAPRGLQVIIRPVIPDRPVVAFPTILTIRFIQRRISIRFERFNVIFVPVLFFEMGRTRRKGQEQ